MDREFFELVGHDAPLGEYPAPVVPVGRRHGDLVAVFRSASGTADEPGSSQPVIRGLDDEASFVRHDAVLSKRLSGFDPTKQALFAYSESDVTCFSIGQEREFLRSTLADERTRNASAFLRFALAQETGAPELIAREAAAAWASLTRINVAVAWRWLETELLPIWKTWQEQQLNVGLEDDLREALERVATVPPRAVVEVVDVASAPALIEARESQAMSRLQLKLVRTLERDRLLEQVIQNWRAHRARSYLLSGPPGTGKTTLALEIATLLQREVDRAARFYEYFRADPDRELLPWTRVDSRTLYLCAVDVNADRVFVFDDLRVDMERMQLEKGNVEFLGARTEGRLSVHELRRVAVADREALVEGRAWHRIDMRRLKDRPEPEVADLVRAIGANYCLGVEVDETVVVAVYQADWPGNVAQLRDAMRIATLRWRPKVLTGEMVLDVVRKLG